NIGQARRLLRLRLRCPGLSSNLKYQAAPFRRELGPSPVPPLALGLTNILPMGLKPQALAHRMRQATLHGRRLQSSRSPHENSAPIARIIGMKSGNEVAMKAVSSTLTGLSAARPITRADIAIQCAISGG